MQQLWTKKQPKKRLRLNMTPLIDVIFLLVVFFMLTTKYETSELLELSMDTALPEVGRVGVPLTEAKHIVMTLKRNRQLDILGKQYSYNEVGPILLKLSEHSNRAAIVSEQHVTVQDVLWVLDQAKHSGFTSVSLLEHRIENSQRGDHAIY